MPKVLRHCIDRRLVLSFKFENSRDLLEAAAQTADGKHDTRLGTQALRHCAPKVLLRREEAAKQCTKLTRHCTNSNRQ